MNPSQAQPVAAPPPEPQPIDTSGQPHGQEIGGGLNIVPIPGSVATNNIDAILESHNLMTTQQAYEFLRDMGVPRDTILGISEYGLDQSVETNSGQNKLPTQEERDVQDLVSLLSQTGWEKSYPQYQATTSQPRPPDLAPLIHHIEYNDLEPSIFRYAPHLRPENIIPPYANLLKQNPQTLQVSNKPDAKGFKDRDPSIVIIYIVGPPGSGKTEVAKTICEKFSFHYLGVAEILERERMDPRSPYRDILEDVLAKGLLGPYKMVPSILISEIVKEMSKGFKQVFVIDGFPRGLDRAYYFESTLQPCDQVIEFFCEDKIAFNRMMMRASPEMKETRYEELVETFQTRLDRNRSENSVVTHYYRQLGKVMGVDAELQLTKVVKQVELKLKDAIISGFVGNRRETVDERNQKAWQEMKQMVERQFMNRAYSITERYDPVFCVSDADGEMDDSEEEEGGFTETDMEDGGGLPLRQNQGDVHFQQENKPYPTRLPVNNPLLPRLPMNDQTTRPRPLEPSGDTNNRAQDANDLTINKATVVPEKAEETPIARGGASTSESSDDDPGIGGSMRTKNAETTPGRKNTNEPHPESSEAGPSGQPTGPSQQPTGPSQQPTRSTSSGFSKRFKTIGRKLSRVFSSSSETDSSGTGKLRSKLSFSSLRRKRGRSGNEDSHEGPGGMGA
ncbi:adenylate kinase [Orbilia blumenaviensis]|uniref:Adenylate kinase n=1 Tax=Orbilia blumenaviensis TaxID=1796055 RepID=A0AAV9VBB7_9PEZI